MTRDAEAALIVRTREILSSVCGGMFRDNWRSQFALAIVAIAIGSFLIWGWFGYLEYERQHAKQRKDAFSSKAEQTRQQRQAICIKIAQRQSYPCVVNEYSSNNSEKYSYYDLNAQQDMAGWAFALYIVTTTGLFITGVGIYYVRETLRTTRQLALTERRPWIGDTNIEVTNLNRSPSASWHMLVRLSVENRGNQIAQGVALSDLVALNGTGNEDHQSLVTQISQRSEMGGEVLVPNGTTLLLKPLYFDPVDNWEGGFNVWFGGWIQYRFAGSDEIHVTPFVYQIGYAAENPNQVLLLRARHNIPAT